MLLYPVVRHDSFGVDVDVEQLLDLSFSFITISLNLSWSPLTSHEFASIPGTPKSPPTSMSRRRRCPNYYIVLAPCKEEHDAGHIA